MRSTEKLQKLEQTIGYFFQDKHKLMLALTHSSYANEHHMDQPGNNERLEFLGDAVLELIVSEFLFQEKKELPEGDLTKLRASIVCEPTLFLCAKKIHLGEYLFLGKGEEVTGGRNRASLVSDAMEALIGAIYLDGSFANAKEFIHRFILDDLEHLQLFFDSKTILQEIIQSEKIGTLSYHLVEECGPDHNKTFVVDACVGERILGRGSGRTKKAAEQEAAYQSILKIRTEKG